MAGIPLETLLYALLGGILPTALWLWFWMGEDSEHPEPLGLIILTYIAGAASVFLVLPLQKILSGMDLGEIARLAAFAGAEELVKFGMVAFIAFRARYIDEPTDYTVYLITGALGFSAVENALYLIQPLLDHNVAFFLLAGNMRFLGATILHTVSIGVVGLLMGLGFYRSRERKRSLAIIGLTLGIALHTVFNYFIMVDTRQDTLHVFAGLWFVALIVLVMFSQLRSFGQNRQPYDTTPITF